jgi:hypothetical protein
VLEGIRRIFMASDVLEEAQRRARALIKARTATQPEAGEARAHTLTKEIGNLTDAIAQGVLRFRRRSRRSSAGPKRNSHALAYAPRGLSRMSSG